MRGMGADGREHDPSHPAIRALLEAPAGELAARLGELRTAAEKAGASLDEIERLLNSRPELPRPLLAEERATLIALLEYADFDGRDALLGQVEFARVDRYCGVDATVSLTVDTNVPSAGRTYRPIPNEAEIVGANGEPLGGVIVFADDGYLSYLEVYWYDDPISPIPPLDQMQLQTRGS
jgi:hypothetical protein